MRRPARNTEEEYTSPFKVNNQLYFCGIPFRLDSYNGCEHYCSYCYVRAAELTSAARKNRGDKLLVADEASVKRALVIALDSNKSRADVNIEWLRHRVPIHWGGMSDPFQPCERKYQITKKWMKYLSWYEYPVVISTKGVMVAEPEYLELLKEGKYAIQVSLINDDDEFMKVLEPGAPSASERKKALEVLAENGIWTAVRIQPVIPDSKVEWDLPEYVRRLAKIGVKHIMAEGYKMPNRNPEGMRAVEAVCPDAWKAYQYSDAKSEGFETLLPTWRKWQYVKVLAQACKENGITFGAADNDLRDMGNVICCCGIDNVPGFEGFWRYQASQAAEIAKTKGYVHLDDMQQFWTGGDRGFSIHNDLIRLEHKAEFGNIQATPKWAIDFMWNKGGAMSPECIYSMRRGTKDGQLIYERRDPIPLLEGNQKEQATLF